MLTGQKLEQHYNSLSTNDLHIIREEYMWVLNTCGVHNDEQIKYIEKALTQRGEAISGHQNKKLLFLCKCGQSRIVATNVADDQIKMFIFDQYKVVCPKCRTANMYTWKYMD